MHYGYYIAIVVVCLAILYHLLLASITEPRAVDYNSALYKYLYTSDFNKFLRQAEADTITAMTETEKQNLIYNEIVKISIDSKRAKDAKDIYIKSTAELDKVNLILNKIKLIDRDPPDDKAAFNRNLVISVIANLYKELAASKNIIINNTEIMRTI